MTHTASHIIISALKTPLSSKGSKAKLYHAVLFVCAACFVTGFIVGQ